MKKTETMQDKSFTTSILVDQTPQQVFKAINNVRAWWSQNIEGDTNKLNSVFDYHYEDIHRCKIKIIEFVPGSKVLWEVLENYFNFTKDKAEWTGTKIIFDIAEKNGKTELQFTHQGLTPQYECYDICQDAWSSYIRGSLLNLITQNKTIKKEDWVDINTRVMEENK